VNVRLAIPAVLLTLAVAPAAASAATVDVEGTAARYIADTGETNDVTVGLLDAGRIRIADPGAAITAGASCQPVDPHTVDCSALVAHVETGDGNDTIRSTGAVLIADGGSGRDKIFGGDASDELDGGTGTDEVHGGGGPDMLEDFDTDPDLLDGGTGTDTVSYEEQPVGIRADLPSGESGDGGTFRSVENVTGGLADDVLGGDGRSNVLLAGLGNDVLYGGGGNDILDGGPGRDEFTCGSGADLVFASRASDHIQYDCERVAFEPDRLLGPGEQPRFSYVIPPYPGVRRAHVVEYRIGCPTWSGVSGKPACSGTLTLRQTGHSSVVLGKGKVKPSAHVRTVRVKLTRTGARLATRDNGVQVTASLRGGHRMPSVGWSLGLHVPRF
jgi:RTX calcium-binding nonapeptide repeat (4 copies)